MTQRSAAATDVRGGDGEIDPDGRNLVKNLNSEFSKAGSESTATAMATNSIHAKAEAGGTAESTPSDGQNVNLGLRCSDRRRPHLDEATLQAVSESRHTEHGGLDCKLRQDAPGNKLDPQRSK